MKLYHFFIGIVCIGLFFGLFWRFQSALPPKPLDELANIPTSGFVVECIAFSPDSTTLAVGGFYGGTTLWDTRTFGKRAFVDTSFRNVEALAFSPDGRKLARMGDNWALLHPPSAMLLDLGTEADQRIPSAESFRGLHGLAFSPDGRHLAMGCTGEVVGIHDIPSGKWVAILVGHSQTIRTVAYSRDGRSLASASNDGMAKVWDVATWASRATLRGHTGPVRSVALSPDGQRVVTASDDGTVRLWDATTGSQVSLWSVADKGANTAVLSPNGRTVAVSTLTIPKHEVKLFDVTSGRVLCAAPLPGVNACLAFSPDGRTLAAGAGSSIHFYRVPAGR